MADKHNLVEPALVHRPPQQAHVLLAIDSIQCSHGFVPEQSFVTNAFALPTQPGPNRRIIQGLGGPFLIISPTFLSVSTSIARSLPL
jgi:hypothetical protein